MICVIIIFGLIVSGLLKRWFWEMVVCPLPRTGDFDENGKNDEFAFSAQEKLKGFGSQNPENDENGGCHSGKTMV